MMGEIALRYPRNTLVVSTGAYEGSAASDARFPQIIDRVGIRATRLRTVQGLALWTWRAGALAKQRRPGFVWCAELKPAGYPARWLAARHRVPYGLIVYGSELLLIQEKIRRSRFKRGTAASIIGNAAVVVAISRWTADLALHKGIDTTMKALAAVRAAHPGTRYAIVGTGERLAQFEQLRDELRLGDAVRFLGGISDAELPAIYNAADLYVGASRRFEGLAEGFGISLVEASACGLAVVGGRSGGVPDAVRDGETGILVDPDDPRAVAAAINRLLADPERRERLGAAGRKAVESYYNWDRVVRDLIEIDGRFRSTE